MASTVRFARVISGLFGDWIFDYYYFFEGGGNFLSKIGWIRIVRIVT